MRGYFGVGIFHAKNECNIGTLMRSAYCFGANFVFTVGRRYRRQSSDTVNTGGNIPQYTYEDMDHLRENLPVGCRIIGVELAQGAYPVGDYAHPDQCVYMLGAEDHGITPSALAKCHQVIQIPDLSHCLNVSVAGSIVLFDRQQYFKRRFTVQGAKTCRTQSKIPNLAALRTPSLNAR
jgi:tRNA G18 (ribose-2'-O)-methylase SpoU